MIQPYLLVVLDSLLAHWKQRKKNEMPESLLFLFVLKLVQSTIYIVIQVRRSREPNSFLSLTCHSQSLTIFCPSLQYLFKCPHLSLHPCLREGPHHLLLKPL